MSLPRNTGGTPLPDLYVVARGNAYALIEETTGHNYLIVGAVETSGRVDPESWVEPDVDRLPPELVEALAEVETALYDLAGAFPEVPSS